MKTIIQTSRAVAALTAILTCGVPAATFAATSYLDVNGTNAGFWDGVTSPISADLGTLLNWTTSAAGGGRGLAMAP